MTVGWAIFLFFAYRIDDRTLGQFVSYSTRRTTLTGVDVMQHFIFLLHTLRFSQLQHVHSNILSALCPTFCTRTYSMQDHLHDVFVPGSALPELGLIASHVNSPIIPVQFSRARVVLLRHAFPSPHNRHLYTSVTRPADHPWSTHYLTVGAEHL
jgi:hypothetical protein